MKIDIKIILDKVKMPKPKVRKKKEKKDLCKCVEKLIRDMENTETSKASWNKLKALYEKLSEDKKFPNRDKLMSLLTPVINRYAQYDNDGVNLSTEKISEG